jgi:hypothetical protein
MSTDEQRVRTVCRWIGVEISRSRVRTPGKAGFGLYRVRAASDPDGEWTPYLFRLQDVLAAATTAIENGTPAGPPALRLAVWPELSPIYRVLTRWTSAYQGRRDLGVAEQALGEVVERSTVRSRQLAENREFQAAHKERRRHGKAKRHAAVLARNAADRNEEN